MRQNSSDIRAARFGGSLGIVLDIGLDVTLILPGHITTGGVVLLVGKVIISVFGVGLCRVGMSDGAVGTLLFRKSRQKLLGGCGWASSRMGMAGIKGKRVALR